MKRGKVRWPTAAGTVLLAIQLSCGGDGGGTEPVRPEAVSAVSPMSQSAVAGAVVASPPSVRVTTRGGTPVPGVNVSFSIASGGGSVTGGSVTTGADGVATAGGWTLGSSPGPNTLNATVAGLGSVTFTANGMDPCTIAPSFALRDSISGMLSTFDCRTSEDSFIDFHSVTLSSTQAVRFSESSETFDTYLYVFDATGSRLAENDDRSGSNVNSSLKILLAPGTYLVGTSSFDSEETGIYTFTSGVANVDITGCEEVFIARGVQTNQQLASTDCDTRGFYSDPFLIWLTAGRAVTITMTAPVIDSVLELYDGNGPQPVASDDDSGGGLDAEIVYTPTATGYHTISATIFAFGQTGPYTLRIQ